MKLLAGNSNLPLARSIAEYIELPLTDASVRRFACDALASDVLVRALAASEVLANVVELDMDGTSFSALQELADRISVNLPQMSRYETGHHFPDMVKLVRIANARQHVQQRKGVDAGDRSGLRNGERRWCVGRLRSRRSDGEA